MSSSSFDHKQPNTQHTMTIIELSTHILSLILPLTQGVYAPPAAASDTERRRLSHDLLEHTAAACDARW